MHDVAIAPMQTPEGGHPSRAFPAGSLPDELRDVSVLPPSTWKWLEELRFRFELAIEVLDRDLQFMLPPASAGRAADLRAALAASPAMRDAAQSVLRLAKPRSFSAGRVRARISPLFTGSVVPRTVAGLLLVADVASGDAASADVDATDRRLDSTTQWLAASIEAAIDSAGTSGDQSRAAQRFATVIDVVDALTRLDEPRAIIQLLVEAIAWWFDADVRAYRDALSDRFALDVWLAGVEPDTARTLDADDIVARDEVFTLESEREFEALGWDPRLHDTLFVPVAVDGSVEWLITVSGAGQPRALDTLVFLQRHASLILTSVDRRATEQVRRRVSAALGLSDAPFDALVRLALEAAAVESGASFARLSVLYSAAPALTLSWGQATDIAPAAVAAGTMVRSPQQVAIGAAIGKGASAVFTFRAAGRAFNAATARIVESGVAVLGTWLSGVFLRHGEIRRTQETSLDLVRRLQGEVDRTGRLRVGGAMAVLLFDAPPSGPDLDDVIQLVHDQVRPSDIIGTVAGAGAGVLLRDVQRDAAAVIVGRLQRASEARGFGRVRVAATTFNPLSESPEELLRRALASAREA